MDVCHVSAGRYKTEYKFPTRAPGDEDDFTI